VVTGALAPGSWLREDEAARELGVSRTPVREAMRRLAEEGLLVKANHQGTMVAGISYEDVNALYAARIPLEGTVAQLAADRRTDQLISDLNRIHEDMTAAHARGDSEAFIVGNRQFHRAMSDATGSVYLQRIMLQVETFFRRIPSTAGGSAERQKAVLTEHEAIIAAIDDRDPERAGEAAVRHMSEVRRSRLMRL
jgi:DNA-binding GntR family transcriptional regulator